MMQSEITDVGLSAANFIFSIVSGSFGVDEVSYHLAYSYQPAQYFIQGATAETPCPKVTYNSSVGASSANCLTTPAGH